MAKDGLGLLELLLQFAVEQLPLLIVYGVGIGMALGRWQRHPRVSQLTVLACSIFLINFLGYSLARSMLLTHYSFAFRFFNATVQSVGIGILFAALFGWRKTEGVGTARVETNRQKDDSNC